MVFAVSPTPVWCLSLGHFFLSPQKNSPLWQLCLVRPLKLETREAHLLFWGLRPGLAGTCICLSTFCKPPLSEVWHFWWEEGLRSIDILALERCFIAFKQWCSYELYFYKCRVMFWCSSWPSSVMTSKGLREFLVERRHSVPVSAQGEPQATGDEEEDEEEFHLIPCSANALLPALPNFNAPGQEMGLRVLLEARADPQCTEDVPEESEVVEDKDDCHESEFSELGENRFQKCCYNGLSFQLPCDNDPFLQKLMSNVAAAKAAYSLQGFRAHFFLLTRVPWWWWFRQCLGMHTKGWTLELSRTYKLITLCKFLSLKLTRTYKTI